MRSIARVFSFDVLSKFAMGFTSVLIIRFMQPEEYARYTVALSIIAIVSQVLVATFNRIYVVGMERLNLTGSQASFLGLQLLLVAFATAVTAPAAGAAGGLFWLVVAVIISMTLSEYTKTCFQRELRFSGYSAVEVARSGLFLIAIVALVHGFQVELTAGHALAVQSACLASIFVVSSGKTIDLRQLFQPGPMAQLMMSILQTGYKYLFGYFAVLAVFSQVDTLSLVSLAGPGDVATYGSAFRYYAILSIALGAVNSVLLPTIQTVRTAGEMSAIFASHRRMLLCFIPVVLVGAWAAEWIIPLIDGGKYPGAIPVFRVLALSSIVSFALSPHANIVMRAEDFRFLLGLGAGGLCLSVGLHAMAVPLYGPVGAAWATLASFAFLNGGIFLRAQSHWRVLREGLT